MKPFIYAGLRWLSINTRLHGYEGYSPDLHSAQSSDIAYKVMRYLCRNYAAKLTLDDISAEVFKKERQMLTGTVVAAEGLIYFAYSSLTL